jgi:MATE family multidrug resistance protein
MLTKKEALKQLLIFAAPIMMGHLGIMLIGTGDMIIAGRYSIECLAAIGLAISISNPVMISLLGLQFTISPLLAQKRGQGEDVTKYFWTVIFYSMLVSIVSCVLSLLSLKLVPLFGYAAGTERIIADYIFINAFSSLGLCLYQGSKEYFQSQEKALVANLIALVAVGVNLLFNYAFVFGAYGMPELKEVGLAWASFGVRCFMGVTLFLMTYQTWRSPRKIEWGFIKEMWKLGVPVAVALFLEIMAFCSVTLFVGKFAEIQTAANNLALNLGSLAFMVPMSIASAVAVKVGHSYGERNIHMIRTFNQVGLFASFCFTLLMGLFFYIWPDPALSLYTADAPVIEWAKKLLFWVACFQLFDGAQVTLSGILRGLSVSRSPSVAIFIGYWIIGIPLGYYLGFHAGLEAQGFWIGLALSLALVALMLGEIMRRKMRELVFE